MIADLIASGQAKISAEQQRQQDDDKKRAEELLIYTVTQEAELEQIVAEYFPDAVLPYIVLCSTLPLNNDGEVVYRIEVPECTAVWFKVERQWVSDEEDRGYHFTELVEFRRNEYGEEREYGTFEVDCLGVVETDENGFIVSTERHWLCDDFEVALAYANRQYARRAELQVEADRKNAQWAEKQARAQALDLQKDIAQAKADLQLADMMDDPIMGPLLNLVNSIMRERADTNQRIADLHEALEMTEYYHSEAVSRLEKRVSEEARRRSEAEREAESARYKASEAEDNLRKATKNSRRWG